MRLFTRATALVGALLVAIYGLLTTRDEPETTWLVVAAVVFVLLGIAFWPSVSRKTPLFERSLIRVAAAIMVAFVMISLQLVRLQVVDSGVILSREAVAKDGTVVIDPRQQVLASEVIRGRILAAGGQPIADTVPGLDGSWVRSYSDPAASYVAGYYSPALYGSSNLEASYDAYLNGEKGGNPLTEWLDGILHRNRRGYDLTLSLNLELQDKANQLLGNQRGAVILMDAKTGAVLAMVSKPYYDPSQLFANLGPDSDQQIARAKAYWQQLNQSGQAALIFRPTQGLYVPGSIFKTVTASAALETGTAKPDTVYRDEGALAIGSRVIQEQNRPDPNQVNYTLAQAYSYSLNVVFAQIGLQLGPAPLEQYGAKFGIGQPIPFDFPVAESQLYQDPNFLSSQAALADTSFGQGQLLVTPLQMALIADAVANGGQMMRPSLVQRISTYDGKTLEERQPEVWKQAISQQTASQMRAIMLQSVEQGWAKGAQIPGYQVGGKTGTAEVGGNQNPQAWFIGFAGKDAPQYVVAVIVEHGGEGTQVALPIGREMLKAALELPAP